MGFSYANFRDNGEVDTNVYDYVDGKYVEKDENVSFYDGIIKRLKEEAKCLNRKLEYIRTSKDDMNQYIATLKSLRETLDLISKYDWQLRYSEYIIEDNIKQVAIWYQNHDNQIKEYKVWDVK